MIAWTIVVVAVVATVALGVVLVRQPFPGDRSEQHDRPKRQGRHVVERPAGPGAEDMDPDGSS